MPTYQSFSKKTFSKNKKGGCALHLVEKYLRQGGQRILGTEVRAFRRYPGAGEVDILSFDPHRGIFWLCEVKYSPQASYLLPLLSKGQIKRLSRSRQIFGSIVRNPRKVQILLAWVKSLEPPCIEFLENPC